MNGKRFLNYFINEIIGRFTGFIIGMWATNVVSIFFEKRGINNLWGLTAKRKVLDKNTFENIEWIVSVVIGFVVYEIISRVIKDKVVPHVKAFSEKHGLEQKARTFINEKIISPLTLLIRRKD